MMEFVSRTAHPFGTFDLAAIGAALTLVMLVLGARRILRRSVRSDAAATTANDMNNRSATDDPR
ncbi:hypothetical protein [Hoeflea sp.]|uniref:hypothetical protein n=1 Tax=Hoeflea sp. TaxID=1940281 RepID=UPI003749438D